GLSFEGARTSLKSYRLHKEMSAFTTYISPSPVEDEIRSLLVQLISSAIKTRYPDAEVHPFGSYATKLYLPTGDIDIVVLSRTHTIAFRCFVTAKLAKARVPIVKFVTRVELGGIPVDISFNQPGGVHGAKIVGGFLKDMLMVRESAVTVEGSTRGIMSASGASQTQRRNNLDPE
ncbi:hypothetical protein MPER_02102, partial [Moniliophthora perniciosa FA553]